MKNPSLLNPKNFQSLIEVYFALSDLDNAPYTIPGLALATGFTKTADIVAVLSDAQSAPDKYPEGSIYHLTRAITQIEDYYVRNGLTAKFPAALVKFCLGAYHDVKDTNEQREPTITNLAIIFNDENNQDLKRIEKTDPTTLLLTNRLVGKKQLMNPDETNELTFEVMSEI